MPIPEKIGHLFKCLVFTIMKKIRLGLMAFAALTGVGSAFAFNHPAKHRRASKTYYAYIDNTVSPSVQRWTEIQPSLDDFTCLPSSVACTITSTTDEATVLSTTNGYPVDHQAQNGSENHVYQSNP